MKKKIAALALVLALALSMLTIPTLAADNEQINAADAMNHLQLFLGTDLGYELDNPLNREQGITLLVRMLGKEQTALTETFKTPFVDVSAWVAGYVGYAWENAITNGISATEFGGGNTMTDYMFLTLTLRALGYKDSGDQPGFAWNKPYELAKQVGLVDSTEEDDSFTRGDAVEVFWNALNAKLKGQDETLAESLIEQKVFTASEWAAAVDIRENGRAENPGTPINPANPSDSGNTGNTDQPTQKNPEDYTWEEYQNMSVQEQLALRDQFESLKDYFDWKNQAQAAYDEEHPKTEIGSDNTIDLGELINGSK